MAVAYDRTQKAAKRAFYGWHESKRDDAVAECMAKMWDQWSRLIVKGKNPEPMTSALIKFAIMWVRYDRKIGGRARNLDVYDYRSHMHRQLLSEQGVASTSEAARVVTNSGSIGTSTLAIIPATWLPHSNRPTSPWSVGRHLRHDRHQRTSRRDEHNPSTGGPITSGAMPVPSN